MSDTELQISLAKMLPEMIKQSESIPGNFLWRFDCGAGARVLATEWLHVCWLVEQTLGELWPVYYTHFMEIGGIAIHASWQQRAEALCKVKGIQ